MNDPAAPPLRKRRRRWKPALAIALLLVLAYIGYRWRLRAQINAELAAMRAEGIPVTLAELDAWYPVPTGRNAADLYIRAFEVSTDLPDDIPFLGRDVIEPGPADRIPPQMLAQIDGLLSRNHVPLALVHEGAQIPDCRFPVDLTKAYDFFKAYAGRYSGPGSLRKLARIKALEAISHAEHGRSDDAVTSLLDTVAIAESLRNEPMLITQFIRGSIQEITVRSTERVINRTTLTAPQLARLRAALVRFDHNTLPRAWVGELCIVLDCFEHPEHFPLFEPEPGETIVPLIAPARIIGAWDRDQLRYIRYFRLKQLLVNAADTQIPDAETFQRTLESPLIGGLMAHPHANLNAIRRYLALGLVVRTALTVQEMAVRNGHFPESLDGLPRTDLPAELQDPWGNPLSYRVEPDRVLIYSHGRDGVDDGGKRAPESGGLFKDGFDIVVEIRRGSGIDSTQRPVAAAHSIRHLQITSTVFWIGEPAASGLGVSSPTNAVSAWDEDWVAHYGGVDDPKVRTSDARRVGFPVFVPGENPYYVALPYNDFWRGRRREDVARVVPWAGRKQWGPRESMCKNRWVKITKGQRVAFAQWEDVGPFVTDDAAYVFGEARPTNTKNDGAGIDVSPAVRDYLKLDDVDVVDWEFVEESDVPEGPWKVVVTRSGTSWK